MSGKYNTYLSFKEIKEDILKLIKEKDFIEAQRLLLATYNELGIAYKEIFEKNKELDLCNKESKEYNKARKTWNKTKNRIKTRLPKPLPQPTQISQQDELPTREDLSQLQFKT